jgi:hypothetical protein
MSYKKVIYGETTTLRLEFPLTWETENLSSLTLAVNDRAGNVLEAASAATLRTATELDGAVTAGDMTITLDSGAADVVENDTLYIFASGSDPSEEVEVASYDTTAYVATLKRPLLYDHVDAAEVYGAFATYDLDASDTDVFELGEQLVLEWTPTWVADEVEMGGIVRERAEVVQYETLVADFRQRFAALYPREFEAVTEQYNRFEDLYFEARRQVKTELALRGMDMDRIVDADLLAPVLMNKIRWLILVTADASYEDERETCSNEYGRQFELLCNSTIWTDDDQDGMIDDEEVSTYSPIFDRAL